MCRKWRHPPTSLHNLQLSTTECRIRPKIPVALCYRMRPVSWAVYLPSLLQAPTGNVEERTRRKSEGDLCWVGERSHTTTATPKSIAQGKERSGILVILCWNGAPSCMNNILRPSSSGTSSVRSSSDFSEVSATLASFFPKPSSHSRQQ